MNHNVGVTQSTVGSIKCETDKSSVDNDEQLHVLHLYKATSVPESDLQGLELNKKYDTKSVMQNRVTCQLVDIYGMLAYH